MDNRDGKFVEKLVFFYLSGYVSDSWEMSEGEVERYDAQAQNITTSLATVDSQVKHTSPTKFEWQKILHEFHSGGLKSIVNHNIRHFLVVEC